MSAPSDGSLRGMGDYSNPCPYRTLEVLAFVLWYGILIVFEAAWCISTLLIVALLSLGPRLAPSTFEPFEPGAGMYGACPSAIVVLVCID